MSRTDNPRFNCAHADLLVGWYHVYGGGKQLRRQCRACGALVGGALPHKFANSNTPNIDETLRRKWGEDYYAQKDQDYKGVILANSEKWWAWYNQYLQTPQWRDKRRLVLERDGGVCQGCRSARAVHVHHLTYDNVGDELLFQLTSLCEACHERAHKEAAA